MTETTTKKTTTKRTTKVAETDPSENYIVVLTTSVGEDLVIRANPTDEDVRGFVEEHTRRYLAGEAGGPGGHPAFRIFTATRFVSEISYLTRDESPSSEIDISDLLP